jgi:hypothetical protein
MSECGEDLLVDLSEILFNELAFFRLMQDLDESKAKVKAKLKTFEKVFYFLSSRVAIPCQSSDVDLGVTLCSKLLVEAHIKNIVSKVRRHTSILIHGFFLYVKCTLCNRRS